jgi:hypothetical protein
VRVKDLDSHSVRALLASRALLVKIERSLVAHRPVMKKVADSGQLLAARLKRRSL